MRLSELLKSMDWKGEAPPFDPEVAGVTCDSRKVNPGDLFVAIRGGAADGHKYAASALEKGACCAVTEEPLGLAQELVTGDTRRFYGEAATRDLVCLKA